jgi:hypothetical protein
MRVWLVVVGVARGCSGSLVLFPYYCSQHQNIIAEVDHSIGPADARIRKDITISIEPRVNPISLGFPFALAVAIRYVLEGDHVGATRP